MNFFRMKMKDGSFVDDPAIEGLEVNFRSTDSEVIIHEGAIFKNSKFHVGADSQITVEETNRRGLINTIVDMSGIGKNKRLHIKSGVSMESAKFAMVNESNLSVEIGQDCMFSSSITFRATDGHVIFDLDTQEVINRSTPIVIGDNCWIGSEVLFLKGAVVSNNSIVGTRAVVAGQFFTENVILAGVPAKIVRKNCGWKRQYIDNYQLSDDGQGGPREHTSFIHGLHQIYRAKKAALFSRLRFFRR